MKPEKDADARPYAKVIWLCGEYKQHKYIIVRIYFQIIVGLKNLFLKRMASTKCKPFEINPLYGTMYTYRGILNWIFAGYVKFISCT